MASRRAKEVGVRKVLGSFKGQVLYQFLTESLIINLGSFILALIGLYFSLHYFSALLDVHFEFSTEPLFWSWILGVVLVGALLSGLYPAMVLSSYQPITVLKGTFSNSSKGSFLRKTLISAQFIITAIMIGGAILVYEQTDFLLSKDLGFDADKILVINAPRIVDEDNNFLASVRNFGNDAINHSDIESFTHSGSVPGKVMSSGSFTRKGIADPKPVSLNVNTVDYGYFNTYKMAFTSGRPFSKEFPSDEEGIILNESAINVLGIRKDDEIHNEKVMARGREFDIIGVVENHHHTSLKTSYEPIIYVLRPERTVYISMNVHTGHLPQTLSVIKEGMKRYFPNNPFEYFFLDQVFDQEFKEDMRYADLFKAFSILAIILAGMGLFGMASFLSAEKKKEISIRKVLGASGKDLFALLGSSFLVPISVGSIIACFLLYFGGNIWLQNFPFRIELAYPIFLGPLVIVFIITGITLGVQTLKAIKIHPIHTLRNE